MLFEPVLSRWFLFQYITPQSMKLHKPVLILDICHSFTPHFGLSSPTAFTSYRVAKPFTSLYLHITTLAQAPILSLQDSYAA